MGVILRNLFALEADIVGILPHGILHGLVVELGSRGRNSLTLGLVLVLQTQHTLVLHIIVKTEKRCGYFCKLGVADRSFLTKQKQVNETTEKGGKEREREGQREGRREGEEKVCGGVTWLLLRRWSRT